MKNLSQQTRIGNDPDFINGNLVDDLESTLGTLNGEGINQDIVQFFQKLVAESGISISGVSDNEANGYDTIKALGTLKKVFTIGDWNMDATAQINIPHGIIDYKKIRSVDVVIFPDSDFPAFTIGQDLKISESPTIPGTVALSGAAYWDESNIKISRLAGGTYDNAFYDEISYNRGFVTMNYVL
jgi:hypothetical protein